MNLLDRVLLEWSYKTKKGYPDINSQEDIALFESMFGFDPTLTELEKRDYEVLSDKAKELAKKIMLDFGVEQEQIKPASSNHIVIYTKDRPSLLDRFERSNNYGPNLLNKKGKFKVDGLTITLKPTGEKSGEYFQLKPQELGISLDEELTLAQLSNEIISGISNSTQLTPIQKKALTYSINGKDKPSDEEISELSRGFFNEVNKNFGELHGALLYGRDINAQSAFFPKLGNYRLIDYILHVGEDQVQVSAKAAKTVGNTVKYEDVIKLADRVNGEVSPKIRELANIISNNSVFAGSFAAIEKFGSNDLKKAVKKYKEDYPHFPNLGKKPEDEQSHVERVIIEKEFVKEINKNPDFNFTEIFNNYVAVKYVKYFLNEETLQGEYRILDSGNFSVSHKTKNSPNHDSDKLGLSVGKAK